MISRLSLRNALKVSVADPALFCILAAAPSFALAQDSANDPANYAWQAGAIRHAQQMRAYAGQPDREGARAVPCARWERSSPSAGCEYTILILRKILIYANARSRTASFGMRPCVRSRPVAPH
jgi:hypothetical protein